MTKEVIKLMKNNQETIEGGLELIRVSRNLERVADLATNIAEEVIFIAQARVVKHHAADKESNQT
jgi:phosphate uptake regulator